MYSFYVYVYKGEKKRASFPYKIYYNIILIRIIIIVSSNNYDNYSFTVTHNNNINLITVITEETKKEI